jgi:hypothetical protein
MIEMDVELDCICSAVAPALLLLLLASVKASLYDLYLRIRH